MTELVHAKQGAPVYEQTGTETGRLGMWWFLASEIVIFGGLICTYILFRWRHADWGAEALHTMNIAGGFNTIVLLTSSLTVVMAHEAVAHERFKQAANYLSLTLIGGLVFLCVKAYEYSHEISEGFVPAKSLFWSYYYAMTGLHALHVLGGMVAIFVVMLAIRKGRDPQRVEYVGIYWHFVDVVWIFLYPLLYLAS
jgi:heme/copper-type cytochrome/quinol oxidase subunit 3